MKIDEIARVLKAEILTQIPVGETEVDLVCASDLMSDVLSFSKSRAVLVTSLTNIQTVRTAEMTEISVVCFVNGKKPGDDAVKLAEKNSIFLLLTGLSMYGACGRLFDAGLGDCYER
ncbi:MAG: hypothetical protein JW969_12105 [Spirochaetales bacterium]|nr:hypothetical protein [Spirochaetales bacterium]